MARRLVVAKRLVDYVVGCDGRIVFVVACDFLPDPDCLFFVVIAVPELVLILPSRRVINALPARSAVHVENRVEPVSRGHINRRVEPLERVLLQFKRLLIVHQQGVIERQAHDVESERADDRKIPRGNPTRAVEIHQAVFLLLAEAFCQDGLELMLVANVVAHVEHPRFEQEPVAEVAALEDDRCAGLGDGNARFHGNERERGPGGRPKPDAGSEKKTRNRKE